MKTSERAATEGTRRGSLTREVIVEAAIDVIDEAGLEGLTMRRLGAALAVDAMAVYGYFTGKAELLDAVVEHEAARLGELSGRVPGGPDRGHAPHGSATADACCWNTPTWRALVASRPLPPAGGAGDHPSSAFACSRRPASTTPTSRWRWTRWSRSLWASS